MRGLRTLILATVAITAFAACGEEDDGFDWNDEHIYTDGNVGLGDDGSLGQGGGLVTRVDRDCPPRDAEGVTFLEEDPSVCAQLDLRCTGGELPFLMEAAERSPADRKGGHLARRPDGRLILREAAQCPPDELEPLEALVRDRMQHAIELRVPLVVDIGHGASWAEAKE